MIKTNENKIGYKNTKISWIPEEWKLVKVKDYLIITTLRS